MHCASDGRQALSKLLSGELPSAILLDMMMPVTDGETFRREQLTYPQLADIPVLILSATADCKKAPVKLRTRGCIQKAVRA